MVGIIRTVGKRLPAPIKYPLLDLAATALFLLKSRNVTTPDGNVFTVPRKMNPIDYFALLRGEYERPEIEIMRTHFKVETGTIIEIGANIGVVSRYAFSEKLADGGNYICVEPNPNSISSLYVNMQRAQAGNGQRYYSIVEAAISDPSTGGAEENFYVRPNLSSGLASQLRANKRETTARVHTTSLSAIIKSGIKTPISLVCDAEGAEIDMVAKDAAAFSFIHQIAIELHDPKLTGRPETQEVMLSRIENLGFRTGGRAGNTYYLSRDI